MMPPSEYAKLAAALVSAVFAVLVFIGGPRRPANQFLAFFFALIAAYQATLMLAVLGPASQASAYARAGLAISAVEPLVLYYFASVFPERNRLNGAAPVALLALAGGVLAAFAVTWPAPAGPTEPRALWLGVDLVTAAAYLAVLGHLRARLLEAPASAALRLLVVAFSLVVLPVTYRAAADLGGLAAPGAALPEMLGLASAFALAAGMVVGARAREAVVGDSGLHRVLLAAAGVGLGVTLMMRAPTLVGLLGFGGLGPSLVPLVPIGAWLRWLFFASLVSMAVLRHEVVFLSLPTRRFAARALIAIAVLGSAVAVVAVAQGSAPESPLLRPAEVVLLLLALLATQGFSSVVDRVAAFAYGVPARDDKASAFDVYREAAAHAFEGGREPRADPALGRLQRQLGIDDRTAAVLASMAEGVQRAPLTSGRVLGGRYRVERALSAEGASRAFAARDELLERGVLLREVVHDLRGGERRALSQARAAGALTHPNIAVVHDALQAGGATYLVFERPGLVLQEKLADGPLSLPEAAQVLDGVLAALQAAHAEGLVHGTLGPSDVALGSDDAVKVGGFGLLGVQPGITHDYLALPRGKGILQIPPELARGEAATSATDVFLAGRLVEQCLGSCMPPRVRAVVDRAVAADSHARWPTVGAMRAALAEAFHEPSAL